MAVVNCEHEAPVRQMADLGYGQRLFGSGRRRRQLPGTTGS